MANDPQNTNDPSRGGAFSGSPTTIGSSAAVGPPGPPGPPGPSVSNVSNTFDTGTRELTTTVDGITGAPVTIPGGSGSGTVTSVALTAPAGITVSGSPITTSGTLGLSLDSGYSLFNPENSGTTNEVLTRTSTGYSWEPGGGGGTTPVEHFTFTVSPSQITQGAGTTTVTANFGVTGAGFTYTGYRNLSLRGPTTVNPTAPSGTASTTTFTIPNTDRGTYTVSVEILSTNASGDPIVHDDTASIHVNAQWYGGVLTAAPTDTAGLTAEGAYHPGVQQTFTGISNGRVYIAVPSGVTPRFISGNVSIVPTQITSGWTPSTHTLWDLGRLVSGTLTVEVQS